MSRPARNPTIAAPARPISPGPSGRRRQITGACTVPAAATTRARCRCLVDRGATKPESRARCAGDPSSPAPPPPVPLPTASMVRPASSPKPRAGSSAPQQAARTARWPDNGAPAHRSRHARRMPHRLRLRTSPNPPLRPAPGSTPMVMSASPCENGCQQRAAAAPRWRRHRRREQVDVSVRAGGDTGAHSTPLAHVVRQPQHLGTGGPRRVGSAVARAVVDHQHPIDIVERVQGPPRWRRRSRPARTRERRQ